MNTALSQEKEIESIFMKGSHAVVLAITLEYKQYDLPESDLYDLFYFGCVFLGVLMGRLPRAERLQVGESVPSFIHQASEDGMNMCTKIMSAKVGTSEDREFAMQQLMSALGGSVNADSEALLSISQDIHEMAMKEGGLWKQKNLHHHTKGLEVAIVQRFEQIINEVLAEARLTSSEQIKANPVIFFLVAVLVNVGLTAGYGAVLFKQPIEEFMKEGLEKFKELIHSDPQVTTSVH